MIASDLGELVRASARSWWEVRYANGRAVAEWEVAAGAGFAPRLLESGRWEDLDREGLIGVRLFCPDGSIAELASREDGRLFQFKVGGVAATAGRQVHWCAAQVIGAVVDTTGRCVCRAWEHGERRLLAFEDNVFAMRYRTVGALALDHLGVKI